ncbi:MAG: hypothetical protein ACPGRD_03235 [Planktomarina sp.]
MSLNVGCMIRRTNWRNKLPGGSAKDWLARIHQPATVYVQDQIPPGALTHPQSIVIFSHKGYEMWLGLGIFHVFNTLCQMNDFTGLGTGVVLVAEDTSGYYGIQEFFDGMPGWGGQVMSNPPVIWNRSLEHAQFAKLPDKTRHAAFSGIAELLGADPMLVEKSITGQNSKGRYGIAWNGEKQQWVLAVMGASGPAQFQELNPATFVRTGIPFDGLDHPDGWPCFWRQNNLFAAVQDHLSRAWCNQSLSDLDETHPACQGECVVMELHIAP